MSSHNFDKIPYIKGPDYTEYGSLASRDKLLWILRKMLEMRIFEEKVEELFLVEGSLIGPSHLYLGEEAIATGVAAALRDDDPFVTTYRCHGHALAKGVRMDMLMAELFGKETGTCKGLG
ncbi:MAG: thiamine pyrophosphate-dependent enzyme, partial [Nitrososphaerota archaeon]